MTTPVAMAAQHRAADAVGQPEIVGGDDQQPAQSRPRVAGRQDAFSSPRSRTISPSIVLITAGEDSVETPRVRGK